MDRLDSQASSLTSAVERVLASSQRVVVDRIDLLRLEAREDIGTAMRGAILVLGGAILLFYGWIVLVAWVSSTCYGARSPSPQPLVRRPPSTSSAGPSSDGSERRFSVAFG